VASLLCLIPPDEGGTDGKTRAPAPGGLEHCWTVALVLAAALTVLSDGTASQQRFEVYWDPAQYTAALREAGGYLRMALAADDIFIVTYVAAIGFAALGFRAGNPAVCGGTGALTLPRALIGRAGYGAPVIASRRSPFAFGRFTFP
jgi:hypothetical protein